VVLDADELGRIFVSQYRPQARYGDDPSEGPIYPTAMALADRHRAFFDALREKRIVAKGTFKDRGQDLPVPATQWGRDDRYLDVENGDLWESGAAGATWESLTLRLPKREELTKPQRPRPANKALEAELGKRGLADGRHGRTDMDIAHDLVDPRLTGDDLDRALDRIRKQLKRYYERRDHS